VGKKTLRTSNLNRRLAIVCAFWLKTPNLK